ncbi:hypothetical protein COW91_01465, partial [Candidatus Nomurabacteria bacterium CG22_combo_CG10-13_8_21_14_all_32_8]
MTDKNYPVKNKWILKQVFYFSLIISFWIIFIFLIPLTIFVFDKSNNINSSIFAKIIILIFIFLIILLLFSIIPAIIFYLIRKNFHFEFTEKFINLEQGIINKQKRYIPYSVIQNVLIDYDFIDRFFGLANLVIENASSGGGAGGVLSRKKNIINIRLLGFGGNRVNIL